jgi:transposase-like protein
MVVKKIGLVQFSNDFPDDDTCRRYLYDLRFGCGINCLYCGSDKVTKYSDGTCKYATYQCRGCRKTFNELKNTIFFNSKIPLQTWFYFIYVSALNKKNISSIQNGKNLAFTQTTAWRLMSKVRNIYEQDNNLILSGVIEVDECFVSKKDGYLHQWGGCSNYKGPVIGMIERGGKVIIQIIPDRTKETLEKLILERVERGSTIYTDGHYSYRDLHRFYYHDWVDHSKREWVRGDVHTNNIEGVWAQLKKAIRNAHHSVSAKHLQSYCDEIAYRFNTRHLTEVERFNDMLERCCNKNIL